MHLIHAALAAGSLLVPALPAAAQQTANSTAAEAASPFGLSLSTGLDYSTGDYGQAEKTEILVVPFTMRATTGNLALTGSIPYLRIDGPGGVVVGPGGQPLPGVPTTSGKRSGVGDLSLGATYTLPPETLGGLEVGLGARVKLPTAARSRQLSTGKTDYTLSADISYAIGNVSPFVNLGYRILGDPDGVDLRNGPTASIGATALVGKATLIGSYDYARAITPLVDDSHELFGGLSAPLGSRVTLTGYGVAGMSKGSPDFGAGLLLTVKAF